MEIVAWYIIWVLYFHRMLNITYQVLDIECEIRWTREVGNSAVEILQSFVRHRSDRILDFAGPNKILSDQIFHKAYF